MSPRVVVVLVGPVGAGKSTFAGNVIKASPAPWVRVNQDTLKTRPRCEVAAKQALRQGKSVLVDRCNFDKAQRAHWVHIAAQEACPCCAVWLDIGADVAANRAAQRRNHEGGVNGTKGRILARSMSKLISKDGGPKAAEGFSLVARLRSDSDVQSAVTVLAACGSSTDWQQTQTVLAERFAWPGGATGGSTGPAQQSLGAWLRHGQADAAAAQPATAPVAALQPHPQAHQGAAASVLQPVDAVPSASRGGADTAFGSLRSAPSLQAAGHKTQGCEATSTTTDGNAFGTMMSAAAQQRSATVAAATVAASAPPSAAQADGANARPDSKAQVADAGSDGLRSVKERIEAQLHGRQADSDAAPGPSVFGWTATDAAQYQGIFTHWVQSPGLAQQQPGTYVIHDEHVLVVHDRYPKGRCHGLVIPRQPGLLDISCLRRAHLPLLRHMRAQGTAFAAHCSPDMAAAHFAMGFHWSPSMMQLHMHVISRDYAGSHMKKPNHWRSFCSPFFRALADVESELATHGRINMDFDAIHRLTRAPLQCPRCGRQQPSLPAAKQHLAACQVPFPGDST